MGRWRYLNLAILLATAVFFYIGVFTSGSPLTPRALGDVVRPWQTVGGIEVRVGHAGTLDISAHPRIEVQFCPRCYRRIERAGVRISATRPHALTAEGVARIHGNPHRFAAHGRVAAQRCGPGIRIWLGVKGWDGAVDWTSWPLRPSQSATTVCVDD